MPTFPDRNAHPCAAAKSAGRHRRTGANSARHNSHADGNPPANPHPHQPRKVLDTCHFSRLRSVWSFWNDGEMVVAGGGAEFEIDDGNGWAAVDTTFNSPVHIHKAGGRTSEGSSV